MDVNGTYRLWCTSDVFDEATKRELLALTDPAEIKDRFYRELSFGTGGMRGILGAGTNRMNLSTVGKATQGLSEYINSCTRGGSVVIAYDSRHMSREFALDSARILAANGIRAYLFDGLRPTPELSFAVRMLRATAGIVITASHNPPAYNGYKVYWSDGGQIVPPRDGEIVAAIARVPGYGAVKRMEEAEARQKGLIERIGKDVDDAFDAAVMDTVIDRAAVAAGRDLRIVYTPLHGTGNLPVRRILSKLGFARVSVVPQQELPDGDFPTVRYPNPEEKESFRLALELAGETDAELVLATDPDADRLGVYVRASAGEYVPLTGNMSGLLLAEYRLSRKRELGLLPEDPACAAIVSTIVSSDMVFPLAREYGVSVIRTLTGFKYIGEQIRLFEEARAKNGGRPDAGKGAYEYEFGFEESYGCLVGTHARDKDAVSAAVALCEAAAYYRTRGQSLLDVMRDMYRRYGCFRESLASFTRSGEEGAARIRAVTERLRTSPPVQIGPYRVLAVSDYLNGVRRVTADGACTGLSLPKSDVIYFELEGGWCCVRPSGTEPKIKFYFGVKGADEKEADAALLVLRDAVLALTEDARK